MAIAASGDSKAPRFRHHNAKRARKRARSNAISPRYSNLTIELTFFGDTFKCLARTLDAVLMLVAFLELVGRVVGRARNVVLGAPRFAEGQRVVVFLGGSGPRVPWLLGLNQGLYRLTVNAAGVDVVLPPAPMPGVSGPVVRGAADRAPAALSEFEGRVLQMTGEAR